MESVARRNKRRGEATTSRSKTSSSTTLAVLGIHTRGPRVSSGRDDKALLAARQCVIQDEEAPLLAPELREKIHGHIDHIYSPVVRADADKRLDDMDEERKKQ